MSHPILLDVEPLTFTKKMGLEERVRERLRYARDRKLSHALIGVEELRQIVEMFDEPR